MSQFFPALASTDVIGINSNGKRKSVSVREWLPAGMKKKFLTSLSFDESVHYESADIEEVFIDCGAFHYFSEKIPRFKRGGYVNATSAMKHYIHRHIQRENSAKKYLVCSPDHIISPQMDDQESEIRTSWTLKVAKEFMDVCANHPGLVPVGVVHGRNMEERAFMVEEYITLGYEYIAFGGLVPLARNESVVLQQIAGITDSENPLIKPESPLGIAMLNGCRTHMFGLNSPEWYRWWKRMGVTSFDGSKLSQEGAANGIIWTLHEFDPLNPPVNAKSMYEKTKIKSLDRQWAKGDDGIYILEVEGEQRFDTESEGWRFMKENLCMNQNCKQLKHSHRPDPRTTGSVEHNMGRMIINAHVFFELMKRIDQLVDMANNTESEKYRSWRTIECK